MKRFEELAKIVADEFIKDMREHDFETFDEMVKCFWWTTNDIKDEVDYVLRENGAYVDELDRTCVLAEDTGEMISYRKFSAMFRKLLKGEDA